MNPIEISEPATLASSTSETETPETELTAIVEAAAGPEALSPSPQNSSPLIVSGINPLWLRLGYAVEFLIALVAIISMWSEVGGEAHLDLMPWYVKLGCILGLAWCSVRFTASLVEQQRAWSARSVAWLLGIILICLLMGGITYYYHLHEETDNGDDDTTASAVVTTLLGTHFYHGSERIWSALPIRFLEHPAVSTRDRVSAGSARRDPRLRL